MRPWGNQKAAGISRSLNFSIGIGFQGKPNSVMMASQKPLKTAVGLISLDYNQAVIPLNVAEGGFHDRVCYG
jgi:hypothetical protein